MALLSTPLCNFGEKMPNFELMNIDNSFINQEMIKGKNGTLIFFICNHCPYVKAITKKLVYTVKEITKLGISSVGIMPNDTIKYPEDNFDNMRKFFNNNKLNFPQVLGIMFKFLRKFFIQVLFNSKNYWFIYLEN